MKQFLHKMILCCVFFSPTFTNAQEKWPSPEVAQMYANGVGYAIAGNYKEAIIKFRQVLLLVPGKMCVNRELGRAQYLAGDYDDAERTLNSIGDTLADAECYQLLAMIYEAGKRYKQAAAALQAGITRFPGAGLLYHEKGNLYRIQKRSDDALETWTEGMAHDTAYAPNCYEAANSFLSTDNVIWGLLFGEMYLAMVHDTTGDKVFKKKLFAGYKTMFDKIADGKRKTNTRRDGRSFEDAVMSTYTMLTPVVSDGVTTERLTMVRTRFLMDWFVSNGTKFPFSLFSYQEELIRTGHFDIYNEWLFGEAENSQEYNAWNVFHDGDMTRFLDWRKSHKYHPVASEIYYKK